MATAKMLTIEVAYALPDRQVIKTLEVAEGSTIIQAIELSHITQDCPDIDLTKQKVGVFSKSRLLSDKVAVGDRIEIYRPLTIDPMEARRAKARKQKS